MLYQINWSCNIRIKHLVHQLGRWFLGHIKHKYFLALPFHPTSFRMSRTATWQKKNTEVCCLHGIEVFFKSLNGLGMMESFFEIIASPVFKFLKFQS